MSSDETELDLLRRVAEGDDLAFQQLLLPHLVYLSDFIAAKYPRLGRGVSTVEDVIQETLAEAHRQVHQFDQKRGMTLRTWLTTIADHRACDTVRAQDRIKRGGKHERVVHQAAESSMHDVIQMLSAGSHTASRSVIRHEAVQAVQDAIEELPEHYRQAVQLHLISGKTLDETAEVMNRGPRAVQGLVDRAKKKLVAVLVRYSRYQ